MKPYDAEFVKLPKYQSTVHFSERGGYTAPDIELDEEQKKWWRDCKLGMFIHWGLYAIPGKGEWEYFNGKWDREEYAGLVNEFAVDSQPDDIAREWLDVAKSADCRYAVMVTRHHDGFAMWNSDASYLDFDAGHTQGRDYVGAYVNACREAGIKPGLYYSPMDWRFPGYFDPDGQPESAQAMKRQCHAQIEELMTRYGDISILWYDGGWLAHSGTDWQAAWLWDPMELCRMVRRHQPGIIMSPRSGYIGDFQCDEGPHEINGQIIDEPWEKCMTTGDAWGYQPDAMVYSPDVIIRMLANVICRGGNLMLNIGPDANGHVPDAVKQLFAALGEFVRANSESIFGTRAGIWQPVDGVFGSVYRDDTVYLHVLDAARFDGMTLPATGNRFAKCHALTGEQIPFEQDARGLRLHLPKSLIDEARTDLVLRLVAERPVVRDVE